MTKSLKKYISSIILILLFIVNTSYAQIQFKVQYNEKVSMSPVSARLFILLNSDTSKNPLQTAGFMNNQPIIVHYVKDWKANDWLTVPENAQSWPHSVKDLKPGKYAIRAVLYLNEENPDFSGAPNNGISEKMVVDIQPSKKEVINLTINQKIKEALFPESKHVKEVKLESKLMTKFLGGTTYLKAGVILPKSYYEDQNKRFPVVYIIHGFGGNYKQIEKMKKKYHLNTDDTEKIYVYLHANCKTGHHVFANSAVNGPWGDALTKEFIPHIEKQYKILDNSKNRFLLGHSSGGWSVLWLQINYPNIFNGAWSVAPDAIDFRKFAKVNLYNPSANIYSNRAGVKRNMMRIGAQEMIPIKYYMAWESVVGKGQQLGSLESVYGKLDKAGNVTELVDRSTGNINNNVLKLWQKYELASKLRNASKGLQKKLHGKINIYVGEMDNFFLEEPVKLLEKDLADTDFQINIKVLPKHDHFSLFGEDKMMSGIWNSINSKIEKTKGLKTK